jgi:hypothetical protein
VTSVPLTRLTSVHGSFRAKVMAARLLDEGVDVVLRGAIDGPYALTVGDMARVDLYVPEEQLEDARLVLLVDEVDEADGILDDDRPPVRDRSWLRGAVAAAVLVMLVVGVCAFVVRWY